MSMLYHPDPRTALLIRRLMTRHGYPEPQARLLAALYHGGPAR